MLIGIFYHKNPAAKKLAKRIRAWLKTKKQRAVFNKVKGIKLAIVLGGDGSILHVADKIAKKGLLIPIIRVNFGTTGFLTNVEPEEIFDRLTEYLKKKNHIFIKKARIEVAVERKGKIVFRKDALNEAVIKKISVGITLFTIKLDNDGEEIRQRGDGLILATKTGSTAYNRSASGSMLVRENKMVATMICPVDGPWSRALDFNETTEIVVKNFQKGNACLVLDNKMIMELSPKDNLIVKRSKNVNVFVEFGDII